MWDNIVELSFTILLLHRLFTMSFVFYFTDGITEFTT